MTIIMKFESKELIHSKTFFEVTKKQKVTYYKSLNVILN